MAAKKHGRHIPSVMLRVDAAFAVLVAKKAEEAGVTITEMTRHITEMLQPAAELEKQVAKEDRPAKKK